MHWCRDKVGATACSLNQVRSHQRARSQNESSLAWSRESADRAPRVAPPLASVEMIPATVLSAHVRLWAITAPPITAGLPMSSNLALELKNFRCRFVKPRDEESRDADFWRSYCTAGGLRKIKAFTAIAFGCCPTVIIVI